MIDRFYRKFGEWFVGKFAQYIKSKGYMEEAIEIEECLYQYQKRRRWFREYLGE